MSINRCVYAFWEVSPVDRPGPARSTGDKSARQSDRHYLVLLLVAVLAALGWVAAAAMARQALGGMAPVLLLSVQFGLSAGLAGVQQRFAPAAPVAAGGLSEGGFVFLLAMAGLIELATGAAARVALPEFLVLGGLAAVVLRRPVSGWALLRAAAVLAGIVLAVGFGSAATGERLAAAGMLAAVAGPALAGGRGGLAIERLLLSAFLLLLLPLALFRAGNTDLAAVPAAAWAWAAGSGLMLYATSFAFGLTAGPARGFVRLAPIIGLGIVLPAWGGGLSLAALAGAGVAVTALLLLDGPSGVKRPGGSLAQAE